MAYTPPGYSAVDFDFIGSGYVPPTFDSVDFEFDPPPGIIIEPGEYNLTLNNISFSKSYILGINSTSFSLTTNEINYKVSRVIPITSLVLTLNLYLEQNTSFVVLNSSYSLSLSNIGLNKGPYYSLEPINYTLTFNDINSTKISNLPFALDSFIVNPEILKVANSSLFGYSIDLNTTEDVLVVGAPSYSPTLTNQGGIYTYDLVGADWVLRNILIADTPVAGALFGTGVSISSDGSVLVVASPGTLEIFTYDLVGPDWILRNTISEDVLEIGGGIGSEVFLSSAGDVLIVGNQGAADTFVNQGAVATYDLVGPDWILRNTLVLDSPANSDLFGSSVSLSSDSSVLVVGASNRDKLVVNDNLGAVYTYDLVGSDWVLRNTLVPEDNAGTITFGIAVDISDDATLLAITAPAWDGELVNQGRIYLYDWDGSSWVLRGVGYSIYLSQYPSYFKSIKITSDKSKVFVGAPLLGNEVISLVGGVYEFSTDKTLYYSYFNDISIDYGHTLVVDSGSYSLTYNDISFSSNYFITLESSYSLLLNDVILNLNEDIIYDTIEYSLVLSDINLVKSHKLPIETASYQFDFIPIFFKKTKKLSITSLSLLVTLAENYRLYKASYLVFDSDALTLTLNDISIEKGYKLSLGSSYTLDLNSVNLLNNRKILVDVLSLNLSLNNIGTANSINYPLDPLEYSLSLNTIGLIFNRVLPFSPLDLTLNNFDVELLYNRRLPFSPLNLSTSFILDLKYNRIFPIETLSLIETFNAIYLIKGFNSSRVVNALAINLSPNYLDTSISLSTLDINKMPTVLNTNSSTTLITTT